MLKKNIELKDKIFALKKMLCTSQSVAILSCYFITVVIPYIASGEIVFAKYWQTDDSFYYLTIARNIAKYGLSTFDGIAITNGYHPLYMVFIVPIAAIFGGNNSLYLLSTATLNFAFVTGGVVYISNAVAKVADIKYKGASFVIALVALLFFPRLLFPIPGVGFYSWIESTEFSLTFALYAILTVWSYRQLLVVDKSLASPERIDLSFPAIIMFFLFLSRTDSPVFVIPFVFTNLLWIKVWHKSFYFRRVWSLLLVLIVVLAYLVMNINIGGSVVQISGLAKEYYGSIGSGGIFGTFSGRLGDYGAAILFGSRNIGAFIVRNYLNGAIEGNTIFFIAVTPLVIYGLLLIRGALHSSVLFRLSISFVGGTICFIAIHLIRGWVEVRYWYFSFAFPIVLICLICLVKGVSFRSLVILLTFMVFVASANLYGFLRFAQSPAADANRLGGIIAKVGIDGIVGYPNSGGLGFYMPYGIVNLDGLVNDREYLQALRAGKASCVLKSRNVEVVMLPSNYINKIPYDQFLLIKDFRDIEGFRFYFLKSASCDDYAISR